MGTDYKSNKCYARMLYILELTELTKLTEPNYNVQYAAVCETGS